jgi:hypothetical protein
MSLSNPLPKHLRPSREKVFGLAKGFPHDRNARVRIEAYVLAWNAKHKQEGQHQGPITAAYQRVFACAPVALHELQGRALLGGIKQKVEKSHSISNNSLSYNVFP